jgi:hypothetical protein
MGTKAGFCGDLVPRVFYILARHLYETRSSYGNMKRQVMEARVKGVKDVKGPEGMRAVFLALLVLYFV